MKQNIHAMTPNIRSLDGLLVHRGLTTSSLVGFSNGWTASINTAEYYIGRDNVK